MTDLGSFMEPPHASSKLSDLHVLSGDAQRPLGRAGRRDHHLGRQRGTGADLHAGREPSRRAAVAIVQLIELDQDRIEADAVSFGYRVPRQLAALPHRCGRDCGVLSLARAVVAAPVDRRLPTAALASSGARRVPAATLWTALLAATIGWAASFWCFFPGNVSGDSHWQLAQALSGRYDSFHPPVMSFVWRWISLAAPERHHQFLLQLTLFWFGLAWLVAQLVPVRRNAIGIALLIGLWPPLFFAQGAIIKDMAMIGSLLLASSILLCAHRNRSRLGALFALLPLLYAVGVRYNALAAALPLCFWLAAIIQGPRWRRLRVVLLGAAFTIAIAAVVTVFVRVALAPNETFASQGALLHDVVAISLETGENYLPDFYRTRGGPAPGTEAFRALYDPFTWYYLGWGRAGQPGVGFVNGHDEYRDLVHAWMRAVLEHPLAYFRHRGVLFAGVLGMHGPLEWGNLLITDPQRPAETAFNSHVIAATLEAAALSQRSVLYRPWLYWVVIVVTAVIAAFVGTHSPWRSVPSWRVRRPIS